MKKINRTYLVKPALPNECVKAVQLLEQILMTDEEFYVQSVEKNTDQKKKQN